MSESYADIVIVGGGLSGCALGAALADGQRHVVVVEARTGRNPRFNGELIHPTGTEVLAQVGLLAPLEAAGAAIRGFACVPGREQPATLLPYAEIPNSRPTGLALDHRLLVDALRAEVQRLPGVELRLGERVGRPQPVGARRDRLKSRAQAFELVGGLCFGVGVGIAVLGAPQLVPTPQPEPESARDVSFAAARGYELCVRFRELGVPHRERPPQRRPRVVDAVSRVLELRAGRQYERDRPDHEEHEHDDRETPNPTSHHRGKLAAGSPAIAHPLASLG